jgi:dTDP-4-dehydrorhamnose reductase
MVNALGTRNVTHAARRVGAHLVYVSTDYVFDGTKAEPYVESDVPNPVSVYGRSKFAGEQEAAADETATIVRTSWVCGHYGANMVKTVLRLCAEPGALTFVNDQRGQPTVVGDLVPMLRRLAIERRPGCYHVTNQGAVSWYEFARVVMSAAGEDPERIRPITTDELKPPRRAPRPRNSVLDNAALQRAGLPLLPHYEPSIAVLVRSLMGQNAL